jgi:ribosomal protein L29
MDYKDLEKKSANELNKMIAEERGRLHDLRFKTAVNQLKNVALVSKSKKMIARLQTRLKQLEYENR